MYISENNFPFWKYDNCILNGFVLHVLYYMRLSSQMSSLVKWVLMPNDLHIFRRFIKPFIYLYYMLFIYYYYTSVVGCFSGWHMFEMGNTQKETLLTDFRGAMAFS